LFPFFELCYRRNKNRFYSLVLVDCCKQISIPSSTVFMRKLFIILTILPLFAIAQLRDKIKKIDSVLPYLYQHQLFNGTILIGEKGKVLYKKAFGISSAFNGKPLTTASSFNLASVSKQFTAMMIMILKEQGKLQYDDAVQKYLPSFPYETITIR